MVQLNSLPDELVLKILKYVVARNTPFSIDDCVEAARLSAIDRAIKYNPKESTHRNDHEDLRLSAVQDKLSGIEKEKWDERLIKDKHGLIEYTLRDKDQACSSPCKLFEWRLYDKSAETQKIHLLDWRVVTSVCHRFRGLGKEAFFSTKTIAMEPDTAKKLRERKLTHLSVEDQQTASRYIRSLIVIEHSAVSPSRFMGFRRIVAGFPSLRSLDFFFDDEVNYPGTCDRKDIKTRIRPPPDLMEALISVGVTGDQLDVGVLIDSNAEWNFTESKLKTLIYPTLKMWADFKAKQQAKTVS